jgi:hypothetical protein
MATVDDPVLVKFRAALNELYGDRIERVVLFGSRARGLEGGAAHLARFDDEGPRALSPFLTMPESCIVVCGDDYPRPVFQRAVQSVS